MSNAYLYDITPQFVWHTGANTQPNKKKLVRRSLKDFGYFDSKMNLSAIN